MSEVSGPAKAGKSSVRTITESTNMLRFWHYRAKEKKLLGCIHCFSIPPTLSKFIEMRKNVRNEETISFMHTISSEVQRCASTTKKVEKKWGFRLTLGLKISDFLCVFRELVDWQTVQLPHGEKLRKIIKVVCKEKETCNHEPLSPQNR